MGFSIRLTDSAIEDLDFFRKKERRMIADGKPLRPNRLARWELRLDDYRVFYDFEGNDMVKNKEHNDLYIRGRKVEL